MTFIYFCKDDAGAEFTFLFKAFLEPGLRIPIDGSRMAVIIDVNIKDCISVAEDAIDFFSIERSDDLWA